MPFTPVNEAPAVARDRKPAIQAEAETEASQAL